MPNCKVCGKAVTSGCVLHTECMEEAALTLAEIICDKYCRWPRESRSAEALEARCDCCEIIKTLLPDL
ncbi:hypothetical protein WMO24_15635 [Ruthenibacterium sp. CLA-JM-H11]|uniref:Uncharacterized protein n=1 Tax=Ruthenibacterium intestinale TaxID=3133163 RepID=A0ABV1GJE3_9FIRM